VLLFFGIILVYMIYFLIRLRVEQRKRIFYTPKYYRGKRQLLLVGIGITAGIIAWLTLFPRPPEKLDTGRFLGAVWAAPGNVTPDPDYRRISNVKSSDQPAYAFLHPDSLLNNEARGKSRQSRASHKPRPRKKAKGTLKSSLAKH
jgi:hypothetical protein